MTTTDPDTQRGLYRKYDVRKVKYETDQRGDQTEVLVPLTEECFVLKASDPYAVIALAAYAGACKDTYPLLASDLMGMARRWMEGETNEP